MKKILILTTLNSFLIFVGVFDAVYLSDQALLRTPFVSTAQAPEGCASYTFPRIMGRVKVLFMLFFPFILCSFRIRPTFKAKKKN